MAQYSAIARLVVREVDLLSRVEIDCLPIESIALVGEGGPGYSVYWNISQLINCFGKMLFSDHFGGRNKEESKWYKKKKV